MIYISYYTTPDDQRISSPAANAKTLSIARALRKNGHTVDILSTCTVAKKGGLIPGRRLRLQEGISCKQYALINTKIGPLRRLQYWFANFRLFVELLLKASKNDNVLFYHAIERSYPVLLAKKIKNFRLILEVEEIYSNALTLSEKLTRDEYRCLQSADAYIFSTVLLNSKIDTDNKPYAIIHGTYEAEPELERRLEDRIHVVYAGTLDPVKGGAGFAVEAARYLDESYHVHILGFGGDEQVEQIRIQISAVQNETECRVTYEGCILGEAYSRFIQKCHIGLSTQNAAGLFNDTSFPSKVLSYMANGLRVVSARLPVLETSAVNEELVYYERQTAQCIADAIRSVDFHEKYQPREKIRQLNRGFCEDLNTMLIQLEEYV